MGVGIARTGDLYSSLLSPGPNLLVTTTTKTFVNGRGIARLGDVNPHWHYWPGHGVVPVNGVIQTASTTVKVEGKGVARIGDTLNCILGNCTITTGSPDTFSG